MVFTLAIAILPVTLIQVATVNAQIPEYYLSVNIIGNGVVTVNGSSPYDPGDVLRMTAFPSTGWEFAGWSVDLLGTANPELLLMDSNKTVTCTFTEIPEYYLSVNIIGNGVVTVNGSSPYDPGDVLRMTAFPSTGWEFAGWSVDLLGTANPELLLMDSNKTVTCTFTEIPVLMPTIESCDSVGDKKDTFMVGDKVYGNGTGYRPQTVYDIYVVEDVTWVDGMAIPPRVAGTATTVTSDAAGNVPATLLWSAPLVAGKYDIIVDVDGDGLYYAEADALDDSDIEVTAGFFVIPEVPLGTLMAAIGMFAALTGFIGFKRPKLRLK